MSPSDSSMRGGVMGIWLAQTSRMDRQNGSAEICGSSYSIAMPPFTWIVCPVI